MGQTKSTQVSPFRIIRNISFILMIQKGETEVDFI